MSAIDFRRLAEEAGFTHDPRADMWGIMLASDIQIENFAKLVAEAEIEACARLCMETDPFYGAMFAEAIRARRKE